MIQTELPCLFGSWIQGSSEEHTTSKAEGIEGAPQLWMLPLLEVRIINKLQVSASAQPPHRDCPLARDVPELAGHLQQPAVMYPELWLSAWFLCVLFCICFLCHSCSPRRLWTALRKERELAGLDYYLFGVALLSNAKEVLNSLDLFLSPFQWESQHGGRKF